MTVQNELIRNDYVGNGVAKAFTFAFRILSSADIQAYVGGLLKTLITDYTVTGIDTPGGGTVTFVVAPANLATVTLIRKMNLFQPIDYIAGEKFPAETHERALDRTVLEMQQVNEKLGRALTFKTVSLLKDKAVDDLVANRVLRVKADASGVEMADLTVGQIAVPVPVAQGGTGKTAVTSGRYLKGDGVNPLVEQALPIPVPDGGTGATTAAGARVALDVPSTAEAILDTIIDMKGDLIVGTAADTPARKAAGANRSVLRAKSSTSDGLVWGLDRVIDVVVDHGAVGDGVADDTAAIQAALSAVPAAGAIVFFPAGTYKVSSALTVTIAKTLIQGAGNQASILKTSSATVDILTVTGANFKLLQMGFNSSAVRTAGSYISLGAGANDAVIEDFIMQGYFRGISLGVIARTRITGGRCLNGATAALSAGIFVDGVAGDTIISYVTMDAPAGSQPAAGIHVRQAADLLLIGCDIIHHTNDLLIDPAAGQTAAAIWATNCFFDTAVNGINIVPTGSGNVVRCRFDSCWASSHTGNGIAINKSATGVTSGILIESAQCVLNAAGSGVTINADVTDVTVRGGLFAGNIFGVNIAVGVTDFSVLGTSAGAYGGIAGNSNTGIVVGTGASNRYIIVDNRVTGNTTAGITDGGTGVNKVVGNNVT